MGKTVLTNKLTQLHGLPATLKALNSDSMKTSVKGFQVGISYQSSSSGWFPSADRSVLLSLAFSMWDQTLRPHLSGVRLF